MDTAKCGMIDPNHINSSPRRDYCDLEFKRSLDLLPISLTCAKIAAPEGLPLLSILVG